MRRVQTALNRRRGRENGRKASADSILIDISFRPNPSRLSSRATADLHQPPFQGTAAVCRRPLERWLNYVRTYLCKALSVRTKLPCDV